MLRLLGIVISIGLVDSLNPSTIAPALYLATGQRARGRVAEFTLAVFLVYLIGGIAIALGPGQLLISLLPHPRHHVRYGLEILAGVTLLVVASVVWQHRDKLASREPRDFDPHGKSSWILGATITAVELPTAFPYFAAIAAVVGSGLGVTRQVALLVLFNLCFVLPLLGIVGTLSLPGDRAERWLCAGRSVLQRHWPVLVAGLGLLAGAFVVLLGATGLASAGHGRFGRFARHVRHLLRP